MYLRLLGLARDLVDLEKSHLVQAMREAATWSMGRLLDVGCGDKPYAALFESHVQSYTGVEYEATFSKTENAKKHAADIVYSGDRLPFDDAVFDTVLCNQVAEHVPDPRALCAELVRVLRPGGRLIVTVPFSFRVHEAPHDFFRFTRFGVEELFRQHNLNTEVLRERGGLWIVIGHKICTYLVFRIAGLGGEVQRMGALGYERAITQRPRWWSLPFVVPLVIYVAIWARLLDRIDFDRSDTLGYLLIATKRDRHDAAG